MKTIHVAKAFTLHHASLDGGKKDFAKGSHSVEAEIAEHWFVQGHCDEGATDAAPDPRIAELEAERDAALAKNAELQALVDAYEMQANADKKPAKK